ncbi:hypothetical protein AAP_05694 [Ascosphaera apis ARSEF 7405]|uniref:Uncharacterized protein n=1 Tax=Ascosphaera apis ARSEF 7405 TaxID=392613 RepID=A0A162I174_9EURO|nr:hypothetical protein AAP_05694 [Ascosphaera apis ARSEF 7405]
MDAIKEPRSPTSDLGTICSSNPPKDSLLFHLLANDQESIPPNANAHSVFIPCSLPQSACQNRGHSSAPQQAETNARGMCKCKDCHFTVCRTCADQNAWVHDGLSKPSQLRPTRTMRNSARATQDIIVPIAHETETPENVNWLGGSVQLPPQAKIEYTKQWVQSQNQSKRARRSPKAYVINTGGSASSKKRRNSCAMSKEQGSISKRTRSSTITSVMDSKDETGSSVSTSSLFFSSKSSYHTAAESIASTDKRSAPKTKKKQLTQEQVARTPIRRVTRSQTAASR